MKDFWRGFYKRADQIKDWEEESIDEDKKTHEPNKDANKIAPPELSRSYTPEVFWRSWP